MPLRDLFCVAEGRKSEPRAAGSTRRCFGFGPWPRDVASMALPDRTRLPDRLGERSGVLMPGVETAFDGCDRFAPAEAAALGCLQKALSRQGFGKQSSRV